MRLLVVGANGLLGSNVVATGLARDWEVVGSYHSAAPAFETPLHRLDVTDVAALREVVETVDPDWVVNCAAMTDVDGCEDRPARARRVNARAPGELAALCAERSVGLVHVSTDYVFDGESRTPYDEDAETNPIQEYGTSKLDGERAVRRRSPESVVTRLSFVYGIHRGTGDLTGFPEWVRSRLLDGRRTPLFTDQRVSPTRAGHAASRLLELVACDASGTFHVASRSCVSPYEFGAEVADRMGADPSLLEAAKLDDVERVARRPTNTCLDVSRVERTLEGRQPTLEADLRALDGALAADPASGDG